MAKAYVPGSPSPPGGMLPPDDPWYVERSTDQTARALIRALGQTIIIQGPWQSGKSSLLARMMATATEVGKRVVLLDFSQFDQSDFRDKSRFFRQFAASIAEELGLPAGVDEYWSNDQRSDQIICTKYIETCVLQKVDASLMLVFDEADPVIQAPFSNEFFFMLRYWHNRRIAPELGWEKVDIVLTSSVGLDRLIEADLAMSPFNVGVVLSLQDFSRLEVEEMNRRGGSPLSPEDAATLHERLGGHPYLTRRAIQVLSDKESDWDITEFIRLDTEDTGPYGDHLQGHLSRLRHEPELTIALREILEMGAHDNWPAVSRLVAMGLVKTRRGDLVPRCPLYADYFRQSLRPSRPPEDRLTLLYLEVRHFKNIEHLAIDFSVPSSLEGEWTCIAGINGSGKTSILQAICLLLLGRRQGTELGVERLRRMLRRIGLARCNSEIRAKIRLGAQDHELYLPLSDRGIDEEKLKVHPDAEAMEELWQRLTTQLLVSYGATRNLSLHRDTRYEDSSREVQRQMTLFDPLTQVAAVDVLLEEDRTARPILRMVSQLLKKVLEGNDLGLEVELDRRRGLLFLTDGAELEAVDLPDGFRALVAWLADLCTAWYQTSSKHGGGIAPSDITGIVLLDEIDLHLHPSLQRLLVPRLRSVLPNIQWIVTTHSPLILSSFDQAELVLLDRDIEGGVRKLDRQILGFSSDQVYRWLMGTSPYSAAIEEKLAQGDNDDVAVLLYQSEDRDEIEARRALNKRRERISRLRQRNGDG